MEQEKDRDKKKAYGGISWTKDSSFQNRKVSSPTGIFQERLLEGHGSLRERKDSRSCVGNEDGRIQATACGDTSVTEPLKGLSSI